MPGNSKHFLKHYLENTDTITLDDIEHYIDTIDTTTPPQPKHTKKTKKTTKNTNQNTNSKVLNFFIITLLLTSILLPPTYLLYIDTARAPAAPTYSINATKTLSKTSIYPCEPITITLNLSSKGNPSTAIQPVSVVLVIDISGSMQHFYHDSQGGHDTVLNYIKQAATDFINTMNFSKDYVSIVAYNNLAYLKQPFTNHKNTAITKINQLSASGTTNIGNALNLAQTTLETRPTDTTPIIILFTDGVANCDQFGYIGENCPINHNSATNYSKDQAQKAKENGTIIYSIGFLEGICTECTSTCVVSRQIAEETLENISSSPDNYYVTPDPLELSQIYSNISQHISTLVAQNLIVNDTIAPPFYLVKTLSPNIPAITQNPDNSTTLSYYRETLALNDTWTIQFVITSNQTQTLAPTNLDTYYQYTLSNQTNYQEDITQPPPINITQPLQLTKTLTEPTAAINDTIHYNITVYNTGSIPLENITLIDPLSPQLSIPNPPSAVTSNYTSFTKTKNWHYNTTTHTIHIYNITLPPHTYIWLNLTTIIQNNNSEEIHNTIYGHYLGMHGTCCACDITATSTIHINNPQISLTKTAHPTLIEPNQPVTYTYNITNTGDTLLTTLILTDNHLTLTPLPTTTLQPGQTITHTQTTTLQTTTTNTATITATTPQQTTITDTDTATVTVINPHIHLTKTAYPTDITQNQTVTYTYTITNTGDTILTNLTLNDDKLGQQNLTTTTLQPQQTITHATNTTLNQTTTNTATTTAITPLQKTVTDTDTATVTLHNPHIYLTKTPHPTLIQPNEAVTYTYTITNTGDTNLNNLTLTDDHLGTITLPTQILQPQQTINLTINTTLIQTTTNTATITAYTPYNTTVNDTAIATVIVKTPTIKLTKTAYPTIAPPNTPITYTYLITNTGDAILTNLTLFDDKLGQQTLTQTTLQPGQTYTHINSTPINQTTTNTATTTAETPFNTTITDSDTAQVLILNPQIQLIKTATPTLIQPNQTVTYQYTIKNTGDTTLTNLSLTDNKFLLPPLNNTTLQPGQIITHSYTTTLNASTTNIATVIADTPLYTTVSDTDQATVTTIQSNLSFTKTVDKTTIQKDEHVTYTYILENHGDAPLSNITVTDDTCQTPTYLQGDQNSNSLLDVGETWTYLCSCTLDKDTINIGNANATTIFNQTLTQTDTAFVDVLPTITVSKQADLYQIDATGENVTFTITIYNTCNENVTLTTLTDDIFGDLNGQGTCLLPQTIQPNQHYTCEFTKFLAKQNSDLHINQVTANAYDDEGNLATDQDDTQIEFTTPFLIPGIDIIKYADPDIITCGEQIKYYYEVTNTGDLPLYNVTLTDDRLGLITTIISYENGNSDDILDPAETWIYTSSMNHLGIPTNQIFAEFEYWNNSYFDAWLTNVTSGFDISNGHYLGWCIQKNIRMPRGIPHPVHLCSSYDPQMPSLFMNPNWQKINYIINNKQGGWRDIQDVIWYYFNDIPTVRPIALKMIDDADQNGTHFCPKPGDLIAILVDGPPYIQRTFVEILIPLNTTNIGTVIAEDRLGIQYSASDSAQYTVQ